MNGNRWTLVLTWSLLVLALVLMGLMAGQSGHAQPAEVAAPRAELRVCVEGPPTCDYTVIQDAVDAAAEGDVVKVAAGVYTGVQARPAPPGYDGPAVIIQVIYLSKTLSIQGGYTLTNWTEPDPETNPTTLDAQGQGRALLIAGTISPTVEGLRLTGGDATGLSGGRWGHDAGGGAYVVTATATISSCVVYSNTASTADDGSGGGLYLHYSAATLQGNMVQDNSAGGDGSDGGGLYLYNSTATLQGNTVQGNTASTAYYGCGGGLYLYASDATLLDNMVQGNIAGGAGSGHGGGLYLYRVNATMEGNMVVSNTAGTGGSYACGGGLYLELGAATLQDNTVQGNTACTADYCDGYGGGLFLYGGDEANVLQDNTVRNNTASTAGSGYGGGLFLYCNHDMLLQDNMVQGNIASTASSGSGGGLYLYGSLEGVLQGNRVQGNAATLSPTATGRGGGLWIANSADMPMINNMVADNHANSHGSGLFVNHSDLNLLHTTFARNTGGDGSGIYLSSIYSVDLANTVLVSQAIGVYVEYGTATLEGTLWHGNGTDTGGDGTIITGTVNVWGDPAFVDPDAGDYHLGSGSAAIGAGVDAGVLIDIDGDPRPLGLGYDIGADEFYGPALAIVKEADPDPVAAGAQLTYTLHLVNIGTLSLTATITDLLPPHVAPGGVLVWTPVPLQPGEVWSETVVVTVEQGYHGMLDNVMQVTTGEGLTEAYTRTVTVEEVLAGLSAINDSPTLLGSATTFTATVTAGTNANYAWAFGDGELGSGATVSHVYPAVGIYTAVVTASNGVSELTATTTVTITDVPIAGLVATNDSPTVLEEVTTLTATIAAGSNVSYTWALGDGTSGSGAVVAHTYPAVGEYTAVVTASNSVGELTATTTVMVEEAIAGLVATNDSPTVLGEPTTLTATIAAGSNVTYTWVLGDGETGGGAMLTHTYPAVGVYTAIVTASNSVGELTAPTTVTITDVPIEGLVATNDSPTVLGEVTTLTATVTAGSNVTYTWALDAKIRPDEAVVTHTFPAVGVYTIVVTASNSVSELTATTTVTITDDEIPIEGLVATNDSPTVLGEPTTLTATVTAGSNVTYTWALGDGAFGGGAVVSHTYPAVGVYTAVVTASNSLGELTAMTTVTITGEEIPIEGLMATNDSPTVLGEPTTLTATVTAGSNVAYTWALGDSTFDGGAAVMHTYPAEGVYTAVVTASNSVSELTATTRVTITAPGFSVYLPLVVKDH